MNKFVSFINDESGATAIEYGLIAAAMAGALILAAPKVSKAVGALFSGISTSLVTTIGT